MTNTMMTLDVVISEWRGGVQAIAGSVGLVGHGRDEADALGSLRRAAEAWGAALARAGELDRVLAERSVTHDNDPGSGDVTVVLHVG